MTLKEVARLLQLSRQTLYKLLKQGNIPAVRIGSQWRFEPDKIRAWLASHHLPQETHHE